ncbi:MAG: hypothetical protein RL839_14880 [Gammaproteobacteria bacterium]
MGEKREAVHILWPVLLLALLLASSSQAQTIAVKREYREVEERLRYEELLAAYGNNKELPPGFELQALLALSHYPALRDVRIRFVVDDVDIPLSSRPHWASMLRSAKNRTYLVVIDSQRESGRQALILANQPFNAQVGIIGHELAHTVYYLNRSFFGIVGDALCQLGDCRVAFERATDKRLVEYGLGWQRFDHAMYVRGQLSGANPDLIMNSQGGGGAYMSPAELLSLIENNEHY